VGVGGAGVAAAQEAVVSIFKELCISKFNSLKKAYWLMTGTTKS
jgi:hypothetical protein